MPLNKQVKVYALDTGNFYSNNESRLHWHVNDVRMDKKKLVREMREIESVFGKCDVQPNEILKLDDGELDGLGMASLAKRYKELKGMVDIKNAAINSSKEKLLSLLSNKVEANIKSDGRDHIRVLDEYTLTERNVIAVFDSYFTRTIGAKYDELCDDFMVVTKYYDDVMKDLIYFGFMFKGEKYVYFTSSAGQIRTKKCVFVKESTWLKHQKSIMCGLTVDDINAKGGNNPNKHLAYLALANSATDVWEGFDIDRAIVVDDFATDVYGEFDFIDDKDYSVTRKRDYAPIEHTDGAGMVLPHAFGKDQKNKMVRLPWIKGLLGVFDFRKFIAENDGSTKIKDIYGVERDILADDVQVIFTKSQFKMYKYYESWEQYKEMYKRYGCTAGMTNEEEDMIKDATINYQMLQSLTDIEPKEIKEIVKKSKNRLDNICSSVENMKRAMGITPYNDHLTPFQKAVKMYPDLLNDEYAKKHIRNIKESMVKKFKSGKLHVHGKYTFVLPDFYAACQHWFLGIESPDGLLEDGEVFCNLFEKNDRLDCLRSPHLYREHPIRNNVACESYFDRKADVGKWFCTNAVYTSCKDLISRILQFDVDGDKLLVVSDKTLIEVAERNMKDKNVNGIVPLYYNMRKAESTILNSESIYNGLNAAFTGGNIGIYSNNISKIWNSDVFVNGSGEEKKRAVEIIKLLCMENNYVIDYAKTLYKPERPKEVNDEIAAFTSEKLPHFFKYAKDKDDGQVVERNKSFVNQLGEIAPNPKISCKKLGLNEIDHTLMMFDKDIDFDENDPLIAKYKSFDREYYFSIDAAISSDDEQQSTDRFAKKVLKYKQTSDKIRHELSQFGYNEVEVTDILVKFLYGKTTSRNKTILWLCYGDYILKNIERNFSLQDINAPKWKQIQCECCGEWLDVSVYDSAKTMCDDCYKEYRNDYMKTLMSESSGNKEYKVIVCEDCGKEFEVSIKNKRTTRCESCYNDYRRNKKTKSMQKLRNK